MAKQQEKEEEDYMGDLSLFIPLEQNTQSLSTKLEPQPPPKKKPKTQTWQDQRKLNREAKQREEDEKTLTNTKSAIPESNIGFKMLKQMGYEPGLGRSEPVGLEIRRGRGGIGVEGLEKEKARREMEKAERERREVEELMVEFENRKKDEWRVRRVVGWYWKAKKVVAQLDGVEDEAAKEEEEEEGEEKEEEEEKVITEEDLHEILMKLRNEHHYCLFCGCKYESADGLLSNCPGIDEDDH